MEMSGERIIASPKARVWAALNDPEVLRASLPNCQAFETISKTEMTVTATLEGEPTARIFTCKLLLSNLDPPHGYTISGADQASTAGSASASAQVRLHDAESGTRLSYTLHAEFGEEMAVPGEANLATSVARYAESFFNRFAESLTQAETAPTGEHMIHLAHEDHDHDHDPTNPHYFGLPIGVILAGTVAIVSIGLVLAKFIF